MSNFPNFAYNNDVDKFFSNFAATKYKKHEVVIRADDTPLGVYFIESGFVRLYSVLENGQEITFNIFKAGSYFPMTWALGKAKNSFYYEAMSPCILRRAPKAIVLDYLEKNPPALLDLTTRVLSGLNGLLTNIEYLLMGDAYRRVMATLLISVRRFGEKVGDNGAIITLPLTHQDIASLTGLTRETVSVVMRKLADKKVVVKKNKRLEVLSIKNLEKELLWEDSQVDSP